MSALSEEIAAYEKLRDGLETDHNGLWALIRGGELVGVCDSFEEAANMAAGAFGEDPYLIRQIGVAPPPLPVAVSLQHQLALGVP